ALEDVARYQERQEFLTKQQDDLTKAKADLNEVITKVNVVTSEQFKATFDQARRNFQEIYTRLFQGGEADLILTNESDILNSGVDIVARPPGKRQQSISLLSGGEKALTAIALLFGLFLVKASPFCVLDEVDAPLDDANLKRFTRILTEFSRKTQFLIITHNKGTMETADTLYGVTMEEAGVSTTYAVRFASGEPAVDTSVSA
ncbi:MAG: AAA family ATPase, partial [bacterium]